MKDHNPNFSQICFKLLKVKIILRIFETISEAEMAKETLLKVILGLDQDLE